MLTIRQNAPAGSYWLRVGVSDGVWPDVISGVRVHVRDLEEKAILSSASLRLTGNFSSKAQTSTSVPGCPDLTSRQNTSKSSIKLLRDELFPLCHFSSERGQREAFVSNSPLI